MTQAARPRIPDLRITGLQTSLLAIGLVTALSLTLIGVLLFENEEAKSHAIEQGRTDAYHEVMALRGVGAHAIELTDRSLVHLQEHLVHAFQDVAQQRERLTKTLYSWLPNLPPRSDLAFYDSDGHRIASTQVSQGNDSWVLEALFGDESTGALDAMISAVDQPFGGRVIVGRRVRYDDGAFVGVVAATVDLSALDAAQDLKATQQIDFALYFGDTGTLLASWPKPGPAGASQTLFALLSEGDSAQIRVPVGIEILEKDDWIFAVSSLRNGPLFAGVGISRERILKQWRTSSWIVYSWVFAILAGGGVFSAGLLVLLFRRHATTEKLFKTLSRAVEASPAMVFICDAHGIVEYVNLKFTEFFGLPYSEVTGVPPYFLDAARVSPDEVDAVRQSLADGEEWNGVLRIDDRHENARWVSVMISTVRDGRGRITNFVGSMEDVSHRVEYERRLRRTQKTEALECLVGGISHEFNNMLLPVVGLSEMALKEMPDDSPARKYLERILESGRRAARMIEQIRSFSLPDTPTFEQRDVGQWVRDIADLARAVAPKSVSVRETLSLSAAGTVLVDRDQIKTAVSALVLNAVQAMPDKRGELSVEARVSSRLDTGSPQVEIAFSDSGCGMTEDVVGKAFDPFFTTREVGQGTGLGLSIVRGIMAAHGGSVSIESHPGLGSTVTLVVPMIAGVEVRVPEREELSAE